MRFLSGAISGALLIASVIVGGLVCCESVMLSCRVDESSLSTETSGCGQHSVYRVTWSADGRSLLARSRSVDNEVSTLTLHQLTGTTGQSLAWAEPFGISTSDGALSPDGRKILLATERGELWWMDRETYETIEPAKSHSMFFLNTAVSHDGLRLAGSTDQGQILLYDLRRGSSIVLTSDRTSSVGLMRFSGDDRSLLVTRQDGLIQVWNPETGTMIREKEGVGRLSVAAAFVANGTQVFSFHDEDSIEIWDVPTGDVLWRGPHGISGCRHTAFLEVSANGRLAAIGKQDHRVVIWDVDKSRKRLEIENPSVVLQTSFSPDGTSLALAGYEEWIRIYDTTTGVQTMQIDTGSRGDSNNRL